MSEAEDRIHAPSPSRLKRAREEGKVARSAELSAALAMLGAITAGYLTLHQVGHWLSSFTTEVWSVSGHRPAVSAAGTIEQLQAIIWATAGVLMPFLALVWFVALFSQWVQTGPVWNSRLLAPSMDRLSPGNWMEKLHPLRLIYELLLAVPKIGVSFGVAALSLWSQRGDILGLATMPVDQLPAKISEMVCMTGWHVMGALLVVGLADYVVTWIRYRRNLRMTDQELRDEQRDQQGDTVNRSRQQALNQV